MSRWKIIHQIVPESEYIQCPSLSWTDGPTCLRLPSLEMEWTEVHTAMMWAYYFGADDEWHKYEGNVPLDANAPDQQQMERLLDFAIQRREMFTESEKHQYYHIVTLEECPLLFFGCTAPEKDSRVLARIPLEDKVPH